MLYLFPLFLNKISLTVVLSLWTLLCGISTSLEEKEHLLLAILGTLMLLFVLPVLERGIFKWIILAITIISGFFWLSRPLWLYTLFELSLLPILVLIIGWGVQPERISAGYHLLVYTFILSSPLLIGVIFIERGLRFGAPLWGLLVGLAFIVKTPIYLIHVWLPKAHVEAPTAGSILLAGILLKIGGIGFIWIQNFCQFTWSLFFFYCVLLGAAAAAATRGFQRDGKSFVAYRRVAHINLGILVIMFLRRQGDSRRSMLILNHGLVSSILFLLVGTCFHRLRRRLVYLFSFIFLLKRSLFLVLSWVIACNFSVPPSLSFLGEIRALSLALSWLWRVLLLACLYLIFVAYYTLFLSLSLTGQRRRECEAPSLFSACRFAALRLRDFLFWGAY